MNDQEHKSYLTEAYTRMIERANATIAKAGKRLETAVDDARDMAHELGELTRDEADLLAEYVKRDLRDLGAYLDQTDQDLRGWFVIDKTLIEARLFDLISSVADRTSLELAEFARKQPPDTVWRTGEITGPGALTCLSCGQTLHMHEAGHIPPCPKCHGSTFQRQHSKSAPKTGAS